MLFLFRNVIQHPSQLPLAEADGAKSALPLDCFILGLQVYLKRTSPRSSPIKSSSNRSRLDDGS